MKYVGGKHLVGKYISDYLYANVSPNEVDGYLEPFCGSLGVFKYMTNYDYNYFIGSDLQPDLIELWSNLQKNKLELPESTSEELWYELKDTPSPNALKAVLGFGMSFGGDYFAGYSQKYASTSGRDYYQEFKNSLHKIKPNIQKSNVNFLNKSYLDLSPKNMLIYCDPPYEFTKGYSTGDFNHETFWNTMRKWSENNQVFISSEISPPDFISVWSKSKNRTMSSKLRTFKTEHLFTLNKIELKNNH
jgi:site-specific DNA-adenine methylase